MSMAQPKDVLNKLLYKDRTEADAFGLLFMCLGCREIHQIHVNPNNGEDPRGAGKPIWTWNGDLIKPTFKPSVFVNRGGLNPAVPICHSFITDGKIQFLPDCTHHLAGQTVDLIPWNDRYFD